MIMPKLSVQKNNLKAKTTDISKTGNHIRLKSPKEKCQLSKSFGNQWNHAT